jgi:uridine kinase
MKRFFDMESGKEEVIKQARKSVGVLLLIIAGPTCSGKSFLAEGVEKDLDDCVSLPLDWYFRDFNDPKLPIDNAGRSLYDAPGSYHQNEYQQAIWSLLQGKAIFAPKYDIRNNRRIVNRNEFIRPKRIIIGEGLFAINFLKGLTPNIISVFLDAEDDLCQERKIDRDTKKFGFTPQGIIWVFENMIKPCNRLYVFPQVREADIVIHQRRDENGLRAQAGL